MDDCFALWDTCLSMYSRGDRASVTLPRSYFPPWRTGSHFYRFLTPPLGISVRTSQYLAYMLSTPHGIDSNHHVVRAALTAALQTSFGRVCRLIPEPPPLAYTRASEFGASFLTHICGFRAFLSIQSKCFTPCRRFSLNAPPSPPAFILDFPGWCSSIFNRPPA